MPNPIKKIIITKEINQKRINWLKKLRNRNCKKSIVSEF